MSTTMAHNWYEINQRSLMAALTRVRAALEQHMKSGPEMDSQISSPPEPSVTPLLSQSLPPPHRSQGTRGEYPYHATELGEVVREEHIGDGVDNDTRLEQGSMPGLPALDVLCAAFGLSAFERDVLLMCAGIELDSSFASLCAGAQSDPVRGYATFSLALAALPEPHWSALLPDAPLRHWRLIVFGTKSGSLTTSQLRIDERVLHYLTGFQHLDERLVGIIKPLRTVGGLVPSHSVLVEQIVAAWVQAQDISTLPAVQLCGDEVMCKRAIAAATCEALGLNLGIVSAHTIPLQPDEFEAFTRLWEREVVLSGRALLLDCDDLDAIDAERERSIAWLLESARGAIIVSSRERRRVLQRPVLTFDVRKPTPDEQSAIWQSTLGDAAHSLNGKVEMLVSQFNLSASTIAAASTEVLGCLTAGDARLSRGADELARIVWDACRIQARPRLDDLAQRIEPAAAWDDLVLPELQRQVLRDIVAHVRQRAKVYESWGFASKGSRGLGISALFAGASGTGKTMAAEVLACELHLDLYRIDLSQVVSKYIGETEKNLRRVFDAAEEGGAILLFDEADALFGKRSEVKDSHDRYANIEVSYLLQRMEAYRGLAILTTNMKSALDSAFLRRIRFLVQFPFPDAGQRSEIWRRIFPASTPTEKLDVAKLAQLNVTGGHIRNIALNAAFLAADAGESVRMMHLLRAARSEYAKLEKSLTEAEIGGWL
jgi:AAA+ superfamily predicted ATPase